MGRDERANLRGLPSGIPLIGGGNRTVLQPPEVKDALQRTLHEGDRVVVLPEVISKFHSFLVARIEAMEQPGPDGNYGWMKVVLSTEVAFAAVRGQPNGEFVRVMQAKTREEQQQEQTQPAAGEPGGMPSQEEIQGDPQQEAKESQS